MDISELKFLLKHSAAVVMMENGQPSLVIIDYKVYKSLLPSEPSTPHEGQGEDQPQATPQEPVVPEFARPPLASVNEQQFSPEEQEAVERLNREILALKEQIAMEETGE